MKEITKATIGLTNYTLRALLGAICQAQQMPSCALVGCTGFPKRMAPGEPCLRQGVPRMTSNLRTNRYHELSAAPTTLPLLEEAALTTEETNKALIGAVGPLKKLSRAGFQTTICGGPPPEKPVGDGLTDAAIDLLDLATQKPGIFIDYKAPTGVELFHAGLLMIYVTGGEAYYEPTAIAKREGRAIVAARRRHAEAVRAELKDRWDAYVAEPGSIRDLVPYDEVLREFGQEIADREARPPIDKGRLAAQRLAAMFDGLGYRPDALA